MGVGITPFLKAVLARCLFAIHGIITIWRVTEANSERIYYLLIIPVCLLLLEIIITLKFTDNGEWKWFCPSVLLYLASVLPGLWLLQFDLYETRIAFRDSMGWEECSLETAYNSSGLSSNIAGLQISIPVSLSDDSWVLGLEQILLAVLIVGRWLLPKGSLTRDQLSQLLLVYIGMAADIMEFSMESLDEEVVTCNLLLIIIILGMWSWSLLQFTLVLTSVSAPRPRAARITGGRSCRGVLGCCSNEIWALCITILMQDGPFLVMRLYLLIHFNVINQMMLFFTIKNIMVILLQLYRMAIVCSNKQSEIDPETEAIEAEKINDHSPSHKSQPIEVRGLEP